MTVVFYIVVTIDYFSFVRGITHISESFVHLIGVYNNC